MNLKGVDVSKHNGKIDWKRVKSDGIEFAMIRCGYGNDIKDQDDICFDVNVKGCDANRIPWGTYLYSYAFSLKDAQSEVNHVLRLLKGKKPEYPVIIDMEDKQYKEEHNKLCADICELFCRKITEAGYITGVYANKSWLENRINDSRLKVYETWLAQWVSKPTYSGKFGIWQYTNKGSVQGITGDVDMNICYVNYL